MRLLALLAAAFVSTSAQLSYHSSSPSHQDGLAYHRSPSPPTGEPGVTRVAVMDLAVLDNSFNGDSEALRRWMVAEGIEPTALLRQAIADPATYAAFETRPQFASVDGPRVARAAGASELAEGRCVRVDCLVEVGRALGADRVVSGEVTKLSVLIWFVTARVVDVRSARVLRQDELEVKGVITDLMPKVMAVLARRFANVSPESRPIAASPGG